MKQMHSLFRDAQEFQTGWMKGELHIPSVVASADKSGVVIDLTAFRSDRLQSAQFRAISSTAIQLAQHPLARTALPELTFPVIALPHIVVALSFPKATIPRKGIAKALNLASHFSFAFAVAMALLFVGPIAILETQSLVSRATATFNQPTAAPALNEPTTMATPTPAITSPHDVFSILIPELGIESTITPNVDAADPKSYTSALKQGIAHAAGTGLPEQLEVNKTIYLFAHSTDNEWNIENYNAQFYALKDAQVGQKIVVRFWGKDYYYQIKEKQIVPANDTALLQPQFDGEKLVLQTCYPPGTAWKRLLVVAEPVENQ